MRSVSERFIELTQELVYQAEDVRHYTRGEKEALFSALMEIRQTTRQIERLFDEVRS